MKTKRIEATFERMSAERTREEQENGYGLSRERQGSLFMDLGLEPASKVNGGTFTVYLKGVDLGQLLKEISTPFHKGVNFTGAKLMKEQSEKIPAKWRRHTLLFTGTVCDNCVIWRREIPCLIWKCGQWHLCWLEAQNVPKNLKMVWSDNR